MIGFLGSLDPFAGFTQEQLVALFRICDEYSFDRGAVFAYQGDLADRAYIIVEGEIGAYRMDERNVLQERRVYKPGDVIKEEWLLNPGVHDGTLRAETAGLMMVIVTIELQDFLDRYPDAHIYEAAETPGTRRRITPDRVTTTDARYRRYGVLPGEVIEYESRRTLLLLAYEMILPFVGVFVVLGIVGGASLTLELGIGLVNGLIGLLLLLPLAGLAIYRYLDWKNDYLLMTNRHLVHQEYDLRRFSGETLTLPLDQVQSVRVIKPNFIETFLNIGTIEVTTAAQRQKLVFDQITNPAEFEMKFNEVRKREREVQSSRTRADVREFLREEFAVPRAIKPLPRGDENQAQADARQQRRRSERRILRQRVFGSTRRRLNDEANTIIYGKHWLVLAQQTWWIVLIMVFIIFATGFIYALAAPIPFTIVAGGFFFLLALAGFYYKYEDWANDVFMLSGDLVIDVDRGPFGLTENRKAAQLGNVQDVRALRPNILSALFNYGNVVIDTAGASAEIIFENVANPTLVQSDIFERRQHVLRRKRRAEAAGRRREIGLILREYRQLEANEEFPDYALPDIDEDGEY